MGVFERVADVQMIIFRHVPSLSVGLLAEDTFDLIERCLIPLINICRPAKRHIAFVNTAGVIGDVSNLAASSTINISIIVQCLKSGFWVRKDTLDWGLVNRAVGGSGNTNNVHQGTLSTLSLSHLHHHHQDHWQNWTPPEYLFDPA